MRISRNQLDRAQPNRFREPPLSWRWVLVLALVSLLAFPVGAEEPHPAAREAITAAVLKDFPPLYQLDTEGKPAGFAIDVLSAVARDAGVEVRYLLVDNWGEAMRAVRDGKADVVPGIGISEPREDEFFFSTEIETVPVSWFVRRDNARIQSSADLAGLPVAVIAQSAAETRLKHGSGVRLVPFTNLEQALFALLAGNVDAFVFPAPVLNKKAREIGVEDEIRVVGQPLMELKRGFLFRKDSANLLHRLDPLIRAHVRSDQYRDEYLKWYGKPTPYWTVQRVFWTMLAFALATFFALLLFRNASIRRLNARLRESEDRYRNYVENAPDAIFVADETGRFLDANPSACRLVGHGRDELLSLSIPDIAPPGALGAHLDLFAEVKRAGLASAEIVLRRKDGSDIFAELTAVVLPDQHIMGFCADISERKRAEQALAESEARLRMLVEALPDSIQFKDGEGRWLVANNVALRLFGLEGVAWQGLTDAELGARFPDLAAGLSYCQASDEETWGTKESRRTVEKRLDGKGKADYFDVIKVPLYDQHGRRKALAIIGRDITERKLAEVAVRQSEEKYRRLVENLNRDYLFYANDPDGVFTYVSASVTPMLGWEPQEFLVHYSELVSAHTVNQAVEHHTEAGLRGVQQPPYLVVARHKNGGERWLEVSETPVLDDQGKVIALEGIAHDITERKAAEDRLRLAASVFTHALEGIMITKADATIIEVNDAFTRITGYGREEVMGQKPSLLGSGLHSADFFAEMWHQLTENGHWHGEIWNRRKDGGAYPVLMTVSAVRDDGGHTQHHVALFSDITAQKEHQLQLEHIAHYDALTGLPNRVLLADRMHQAMAQAKRRGQHIAVAYLDLDGFKAVNDRHGHEAGDQLLTTIANALKHSLREGDTIARLGGDEFVAVLIDLPDSPASVPLINRLLTAAAQPVQVKGVALQVSGSVGVAFYPQCGDVDPDQLLRQADQAMYQAKLAGKNRYHVFDPDQDRHLRDRHESLERIRQGMKRDEFILYYQPKVNLRTGEVIGVEALIRWQHPERGLLTPAFFLPEVEDHPLGVELGEWVLDTALRQVETWRAQGHDLPVSVNVSAHELQQTDFVVRLRHLLAAHPEARSGHLVLEILESSALEDVAHISAMIKVCADLGVQFALDDFGTGYSSLSYLKQLPAKLLKIDQSFVRDMLDDPDDLAILDGVLGLAASFGRLAIAEGVETVEHGRMLLQLGCELAQGYGIARPMPAAEIPAWLASWRPDPAWAQARQISRDDLPVLFACVEHRALVEGVRQFVRGERIAPPPLDAHLCRFGQWLHGDARRRSGQRQAFQVIDGLHRHFHTTAATLLRSHAAGEEARALQGLDQLDAARDGLIAELVRFL